MKILKLGFIASSIILFSSSAQAVDMSKVIYSTHKLQMKMMSSSDAAIRRAGQSATSASAAMARGNIGKGLLGMTGLTPLGLARTVVVGVLLDRLGTKLTANPDGTVTYDGLQEFPATNGFAQGDAGWKGSTKCGTYSCSSLGLLYSKYPEVFPAKWMSDTGGVWPANGAKVYLANCRIASNFFQCDVKRTSDNSAFLSSQTFASYTLMPQGCNAGYMYEDGKGCVADGLVARTEPVTKTTTYENLANVIPAAELDKPLTPDQQAKLINAMGAGINEDIGFVPTVEPSDIPVDPVPSGLRDMVTPVPNDFEPLPTTNPVSEDEAQTPTTTRPPEEDPNITKVKVDLGPDPGIMAPQLNLDPPTAQSIVNPFLNLLPDFKNITINPVVGTCPNPTFEIYGKNYSFEIMCTLISQNQDTIRAFMTAFFMIVSVLIILRA